MNTLSIIYIKIAVMFLLVIGITMFLVIYSLKKVENAVYDFNVQKNSLDTFLNRERYLDDLVKDYQAIEEKLSALYGSFLHNDKAVNFIQEIENIAERTGNIEKITIMSSGGERGDIKFLVFQAQLFGDFSSLMKFIGEVENGRYQATIKRLNISKISGFSDAENLLAKNKIKSEDLNPGKLPTISAILDIEAYVIN